MTPKEEILSWLQGPRRYEEGAALYRRHGSNRMLKLMFVRRGRTQDTEQTLLDELRQLAGLTPAQLRQLPRKGRMAAVAPTAAPDADTAAPSPRLAEKARRMERFRSTFPFLSEPSCPDVLKVVVANMFTAYGRYKEAHAALRDIPEDADAVETARLAEEVVENYLADRELWAELEHYRDHGELLGKAVKVRRAIEVRDISRLDDVELLRQLQSAKAQVSKAKSAVKKAGDDEEKAAKARTLLDSWTLRHELLSSEAAARKKK